MTANESLRSEALEVSPGRNGLRISVSPPPGNHGERQARKGHRLVTQSFFPISPIAFRADYVPLGCGTAEPRWRTSINARNTATPARQGAVSAVGHCRWSAEHTTVAGRPPSRIGKPWLSCAPAGKVYPEGSNGPLLVRTAPCSLTSISATAIIASRRSSLIRWYWRIETRPLSKPATLFHGDGRGPSGCGSILIDAQDGLRLPGFVTKEQQRAGQHQPDHSAASPSSELPLGDELAGQRNQLAAVLDGVDQGIEAVDQQMGDSEVAIIAEASAACSGEPTSAVLLLLARMSFAISVHHRLSIRLP